MKYLAVGGLGAFLGLMTGPFVALQLASRAVHEYDARMREMDLPYGCGMWAVAAMLGGAVCGSIIGAIIGLVTAVFLSDPASHSSSRVTNDHIRDSNR